MRLKLCIILLCLSFGIVRGQTTVMRDSLVYRQASAVDESLVGKSIFNLLSSEDGGVIRIHQSQAIVGGMNGHIASNPQRALSGYRLRIFFDNQKTARSESETLMNSFLATHPGIPAYRSYQNPFFKVTVGDFRTKSEAAELLSRLKYEYPAAFIVKENINYPVADKLHAFSVDTVKVYR